MKTFMILVCGFLMCSIIGTGSADVWTDPFDGNEPVEEWKFRDYRDEVTEFEVKDGFLQMTNPNGGWGHTTPDKPMASMSRFISKLSKRMISSPATTVRTKKMSGRFPVTKTWNHKFDVERVGIGFMNNWGGQTVTFFVDTLSIEGDGIEPMSVAPDGKLTTTWGTLKASQ